MAFVPWFTINPTTVLCLIGYFKKPDGSEKSPADFHKATVEAVIPTYNEEKNILLCLESLANQTLTPQRIVLVDDNSSDRTVELAKSYAEERGIDLKVMVHDRHWGKTPSVKYESRHCDADVEFILEHLFQ